MSGNGLPDDAAAAACTRPILLGPERLARLAELGVLVLRVVDDSTTDDADAVDVDGTYREFWADTGSAALLARPDHYLHGVAADAADVADLVDDFLARLPRSAVAVPAGSVAGAR
ncbi:hypothetical protein [Actinomycetospora atypica]|uniref:Uncharacterized protein n=1 Tax=Actinomycetospora atypica TaxID=1290095 RepID=A0ABV9YMZ7_9PSEU